MANWTGMCRSSYSLVKDPAAFIRYVKMFPAFPLHSGEDENDPEAPRAFYSLADDGGVPTIYLEYVWGMIAVNKTRSWGKNSGGSAPSWGKTLRPGETRSRSTTSSHPS